MPTIFEPFLLLPSLWLFLYISPTTKGNDLLEKPVAQSNSLREIQNNLNILKTERLEQNPVTNKEEHDKNMKQIKKIVMHFLSTWKRGKRTARSPVKKKKEMTKGNSSALWNKWNNWSMCSVTCGKGRMIRWRHCKENCEAETEMEEMSCQLPECPRSLFGVLKLQ